MLINLLKALLLGILQGLTEFLPVSSTGHLILAENILGVSQNKFGLTFDAAIHLGTAIAVFSFFYPLWVKIIKALFKNIISKEKLTSNGKLGFYIILATIPAAVIGLLLEEKIETVFRQPKVVAFGLLAGSLIIFLADQLGKQLNKLEKITPLKSLIIGFSQSIALIPGISRSGVTISAGMFTGLKRRSAAEFAFLLSGPIVLGAGGKKLLDAITDFASGKLTSADFLFFAVGIASAAVSGYFVIKFLLKYLQSHSMIIFIIYRIILAIGILISLEM